MDSTQLTDFSPSSLDAAFAAVEAEARAQLAAPDFDAEAFRLAWLGRKQGRLKAISDAWLKAAPADAKRLIGQRFNALKETIEAAVETAAARPKATAGGGARHHAAGDCAAHWRGASADPHDAGDRDGV